LVTEPANADAVLVAAEVGDDAALAADDAALDAPVLEVPVLEVAGADVELELGLELQAAAPARRQAPTATARHLEPPEIRRDIPVKRTMAPCRLSAVNSPVPGPSSARRWHRRRTELIDQ
jgi:hypothetical protein